MKRPSALLLLIICGASWGSPPVSAESLGDAQRRSNTAQPVNAVVSLVDTGINPYHLSFRDPSPRANKHPSTYIPGYPKDAEALHVTFDAVNYAAAVAADC